MPNIDQNDDDDQKMRNITSVCSIPWWRSDNYGHDHDHIVSCGNDDEELTAINLSTTRCLDYDLASATSTYNTISRSSRYSEPARMHINEPTDHHHDVNKDIYQGSEDGKYEQRHGEKQVHHDVRTVNSMVNLPAMKIDHDLHLASTSGHLELFGHSIASTTAYPYAADSYYGKAMPAFTAPQTLVHYSQVKTYYGGVDGGGGGRMPLLLPMAEEPVYVNAKQYHGILKRRQSRAKAELQRKLIKVRKPYLHESRHLHAMRRERGCGGRFLNTKLKQPQQLDNLPASSDNKATSAASGASSVLSSEFSLYPAGSTDITADHHQRLGMKGTNSALAIK